MASERAKDARLGHLLHRLLHVLQHALLPDRLLDLLLRLDVERICLEKLHLTLALETSGLLHRSELAKEIAEAGRVVLRRIGEFRVRLRTHELCKQSDERTSLLDAPCASLP